MIKIMSHSDKSQKEKKCRELTCRRLLCVVFEPEAKGLSRAALPNINIHKERSEFSVHMALS